MGLRDFVKEQRAKAVLILMNGGQTYQDADIPEVPTEWRCFPNSNDLWKRIDFPEDQNTSGCLYQGYSGSLFPPHKHPKSMEHFTILNEGGKIELITEKEVRVVEFPNSVFIEMNEPHAVRFLSDTKLLVMWHPAMLDGWQAEFIDNGKTNVTPA